MQKEEVVPESTRGHLNNADAAIIRAQERISESSMLRARTLSLKVSGLMPAVKLPKTDEGK